MQRTSHTRKMMATILLGMRLTVCLYYLDHVVVFSSTFFEHLERLQQSFNHFPTARLQMNSAKCVFGARQIKVLGNLVSADAISPDLRKTKAVPNFPTPRI